MFTLCGGKKKEGKQKKKWSINIAGHICMLLALLGHDQCHGIGEVIEASTHNWEHRIYEHRYDLLTYMYLYIFFLDDKRERVRVKK